MQRRFAVSATEKDSSTVATYPMRALILTKRQLGEADLIFVLLGADGSQTHAIAKGVRKPKAKMGGTLEVFAVCDLLLAKGKNLDIITEARTIEAHEACIKTPEHACAAAALCEMLAVLSLEGQPQERLFDMSCAALKAYENAEEKRLGLLIGASIMKVLSLLGYRPELDSCILCGQSAAQREEYFSIRQGGVVCAECVQTSPYLADAPACPVSWIRAVIWSTFDTLLQVSGGDEAGEAVLAFSARWLEANTGIWLKALRTLAALNE